MNLVEKSKNILGKKIFQDVSFVYIGALLNGLSLFLINIALGRSLEKEWFAVFSLSTLALNTVAEMSDLGLNGGLLRFAPFYIAQNQTDKLKMLLKTIWRWRAWMSSILTLAGIFLSYFIAKFLFDQPQIYGYLAFSFLGIGGVILLGFVSTYLQARQSFFKNAQIQTLKGLLRIVIIALLLASGLDNLYLILFAYIIVPWILFLTYFKELPENFMQTQVNPETKEGLYKQLRRFSFWLTIWSFAAILSSRIDQIMLSNFLGLEQVAIYAVAFQFIYFYSLASQSMTSVLIPKINALDSKDKLLLFIKKIIWILIPTIIVISLIIYPSRIFITLIFGAKYIDSIPAYMILSYSMAISLLNIPFSLIITAFNRTDLVAFSGFLQLITNFILNLILIPKFGIIGACITFALGIIFALSYNIISSVYLIKNKEIIVS